MPAPRGSVKREIEKVDSREESPQSEEEADYPGSEPDDSGPEGKDKEDSGSEPDKEGNSGSEPEEEEESGSSPERAPGLEPGKKPGSVLGRGESLPYPTKALSIALQLINEQKQEPSKEKREKRPRSGRWVRQQRHVVHAHVAGKEVTSYCRFQSEI